MTSNQSWSAVRTAAMAGIAVFALASLAPTPARADFFDGARQTFASDIPHFFQDDIPCFFGGQPTSHTKSSCNSSNAAPRRTTTTTTTTTTDSSVVPPEKINGDARPISDQ